MKKMNGVFCFKVKGPSGEGIWIVDCKNGNGSVKFGGPAKGDVTIMMEDENLLDLLTGKLNPQTVSYSSQNYPSDLFTQITKCCFTHKGY